MQTRDNGWEKSASAWISEIGEQGDYGRTYVLDTPMLERVRSRSFGRALDIGCGEGRFCRMLRAEGIVSVGIEPTPTLRDAAIARDPSGTYLAARAETLPFADGAFDLVVSYLTLIDIDGLEADIAEMTRVLRPGGSLLIANLNSFNTAGEWHERDDGSRSFVLDNYMLARSEWVSWRGITIRNWHRPFSAYMKTLLNSGLRLIHFDEPLPTGGDPERVRQHFRAPYFHVMEWQNR
ncbi:class I SAM-dependent methyltransferase [Methylobacterium mesophilicum SR1.6/6]|uniref:Class I SAM-dependent methyltransferase n=1 Tax=Methylobacterium mesophilicum SR1.6/6 TaxID=908290 RepID=A0A6B9FJY9_9HYPH|nr:class I SAM-dependent methyltransferase [Methylobacterium mesophilicum]QGY02687.1 class I SAM-dependent methyltransferase [Methylobacterium mesophilicum SR1.6/6]